jgi:hypothetical protein
MICARCTCRTAKPASAPRVNGSRRLTGRRRLRRVLVPGLIATAVSVAAARSSPTSIQTQGSAWACISCMPAKRKPSDSTNAERSRAHEDHELDHASNARSVRNRRITHARPRSPDSPAGVCSSVTDRRREASPPWCPVVGRAVTRRLGSRTANGWRSPSPAVEPHGPRAVIRADRSIAPVAMSRSRSSRSSHSEHRLRNRKTTMCRSSPVQ